jgi:hypothetical protein
MNADLLAASPFVANGPASLTFSLALGPQVAQPG